MREIDIERSILAAATRDTPDLKAVIKADPRFQLRKKSTFFEKLSLRPLQFASAALIIIISGFLLFTSLTGVSMDVHATVYMDINPSIEIDLNERYQVIEVRGMNAEADVLIAELNRTRGRDFEDVLDRIIAASIRLNYLTSERPTVMLDVVSQNTTIRAQVIATIEEKMPAIARERLNNMQILPGNAGGQTAEEVDEARDLQMSIMKLRLIHRILELDDEKTHSFEVLVERSINELRLILLGLSDDNPPTWTPNVQDHIPRNRP